MDEKNTVEEVKSIDKPDPLEDKTKSSRLSLPLNPPLKGKAAKSVNRRHTLVPNRSILKGNLEGSNTISLISDNILKERRRVSFAPEVTLHKIDYSRSNEERRQRKRNSLSGQIQPNPSKLNTAQYLWKSYQSVSHPDKNDENVNISQPDTVKQYTSETPNQFIIDEDSTTQTMEMSVELTQEILKQQEQMKEQSKKVEENVPYENQNRLKDIFDEVEQEINSDTVDGVQEAEEEDMELTETFNKMPKIDESSNLTNVSMNLTEPINYKQDSKTQESILSTDDKLVNSPDDTDAMEFTQPVWNLNDREQVKSAAEKNLENSELSQMEFTQLIPTQGNGKDDKLVFDTKLLKEQDDEPMELTQPIPQSQSLVELENEPFEEYQQLSTVVEISAPPTIDSSNLSSFEQRVTQHKSFSREVTPEKEFVNNSNESTINLQPHENENENENGNKTVVNSIHDERELTSDMETSLIGTEMVPLAEVTTDFTENIEEYDSDNSLDNDNHVSVPLDVFLNDVNVQFYDNIGPSETEVKQTLCFHPDSKSSPTSEVISETSSSSSSNSTPSNVSTSKRFNLVDYIDACTNIPYYHYLIHLINQYQSSIQSISTMVNNFSNDVLESNPTAIREYYQQASEVKADLCTNYQAIATFTRKQAKCQNMRFVSGLLEQLILSYERTNQLLEEELSKALDWRRGILIERQKMIERKVELNQYIQKLDALKDNWKTINVENIRKSNEALKNYRIKKVNIKQDISEISKTVSSKTKSINDKRAKKESLLKQLEELKKKVVNSVVPTENDLTLLKARLSELEKLKCVKFIAADDMTLLISNRLQIVFHEKADNIYDAKLSVNDIQAFAPFTQLVDEFIRKHEKVAQPLKPIEFVRSLVKSWNQFIQLWKDMLIIHFMYSGEVSTTHFKFNFSFINSPEELHRNTVLVKGKLDDILEPGTDVIVTLARENLVGNSKEVNGVIVLDHLKQAFDNKNSIVNRFVVK